MQQMNGPPVLVHVSTVPMTLNFLTGQLSFMADKGYEIHAVASPGVDLTNFGSKERLTVHGVPMSRNISPIADLLSLIRLVYLFFRLKPVIVHSHTPKAGLLAMLAGYIARVPVRIYHVHGFPAQTASGFRRFALIASDRLACALADRVLFVSQSLRRIALSKRLCTQTKAKLIGKGSINGVDAQRLYNPAFYVEASKELRSQLQIPACAPVIGYVGRFAKDKGLATLAAAWEIIQSEVSDCHLILVGGDDTTDPVATDVYEFLLTSTRVHRVGQRGPAPYYAAMDILTLPSYREGFPMTVLEAAAMELPVVASRVTGLVDAVVDGHTGILVPSRDGNRLAQALLIYIRDQSLRFRHGQNGRSRALADFRPETIWQETSSHYDDIILDKSVAGRAA